MGEPRPLEADLAPPNLASLSPSHTYLYGLARPRAKYDLESVERFLAELGAPHRAIPWFHVAGTNGKGSTAAMLAAMLTAAGHRVGLFTSPHLVDLTERVRLDGVPIPARDLDRGVARLRALIESPARRDLAPPSFFEALFALACLHFADRGATVGVAEVGLGGRLDATNVIAPEACVITNIGHDHADILGPTLLHIAREKAGIVKPGVPLISGVTGDSAAVVRDACAALGAPHVDAQAYTISIREMSQGRSVFDLVGQDVRLADMMVPLAGRHQVENARLAILALSSWALEKPRPDLLRQGLALARWPGRFDVRPGSPTVVLDAAHNPEAIASLARTLDACFPERRPVFVVGACADKEIAGMLTHLADRAGAMVFTRASSRRAVDPAPLAACLPASSGMPIVQESDPVAALAHARTLAGAGGLVVVTGSIFLLGDLWNAL